MVFKSLTKANLEHYLMFAGGYFRPFETGVNCKYSTHPYTVTSKAAKTGEWGQKAVPVSNGEIMRWYKLKKEFFRVDIDIYVGRVYQISQGKNTGMLVVR